MQMPRTTFRPDSPLVQKGKLQGHGIGEPLHAREGAIPTTFTSRDDDDMGGSPSRADRSLTAKLGSMLHKKKDKREDKRKEERGRGTTVEPERESRLRDTDQRERQPVHRTLSGYDIERTRTGSMTQVREQVC